MALRAYARVCASVFTGRIGGVALKRLLCAVLFAWSPTLIGDVYAQSFSERSRFAWPDTPEIAGEAAQDGGESQGRPIVRPPTQDWPGTQRFDPPQQSATGASPTAAVPSASSGTTANRERLSRAQSSEEPASRSSSIDSRSRPPLPERPNSPVSVAETENDPFGAYPDAAQGQRVGAIQPAGAPEETSPGAGAQAEIAEQNTTRSRPDPEMAAAAQTEIAEDQKTRSRPVSETVSEEEASPVKDTHIAAVEPDAKVTPPAQIQNTARRTAPMPNAKEDAEAAAIQTGREQSPHPAGKEDSLGKAIGQMIVVGFDGTDADGAGPQRVLAQLQSGKVGGVVVAGRNIRSRAQLRALMGSLRKAKAGTPPLYMVVHEGGAGQSFSAEMGFSMYPSASELGEVNDPLNAFNVYNHMAEELASFGFNANLGPVVDLAVQADRAVPSAHRRLFGSSPKHVAAFAKAFWLGHRRQGVLTALKRFPGRAGPKAEDKTGDASEGTDGSAAVEDSLEAYRQLIESGNADMIMTGQITDPGVSDASGLPTSLAAKEIRKRLREELEFAGVVVSADLNSPAIAGRFSLKDRVLRAISAGADLLFIGYETAPEDNVVADITAIIREAIESGALSRQRIEESHSRIQRLKQNLDPSGKAIASAEPPQAAQDAAPPH